MSHSIEHQKMKPVLDLARQLDIATNPHPSALFEAGSGGFQVWCTPQDHPKDWHHIAMQPGAFAKPCEYVGSVHWQWVGETIVGLQIETSAYALADQKPDQFSPGVHGWLDDQRQTIFNREADRDWLKEKISWLFTAAQVPLPPFIEEPESSLDPEPGPHLLAHYTSSTDTYVVIVSPTLDPETFCQPGYILAQTLELEHVDDFPVDVLLRPEWGEPEIVITPDTGPQAEIRAAVTPLEADDWLDAEVEARLGGWTE